MNFRKTRTRSRRNSSNLMTSMEKWRNYGKRTSRKNTEFFEEDNEEDELKISELKDWVDEFFIRKSSGVSELDQDVEVLLTRKQTLILSTLVPDEILLMDKYDNAEPKKFVGVLLMADVSGFTALSERYNNLGKIGTYRLTMTLNTYLGSLIEVIYSHGGDIIKFAGDAFLALWKTDKRTFLSHTIHTAIACALIIQHSFGSYETDVKVNLKVKLAIAAGNLIFVPIGTGIDMNYIIIGLPVSEAKEAESVCGSGEVILTPTAWGHCYSRNYDYIIDDAGFVTIKTILYDPHEKDVNKPFVGFGAMARQVKKPLMCLKNIPDNLTDSPNSITDLVQVNETLKLRPTILIADEKNIGSEIRKFMIRPVLTQIDAHQPLEYLTEMRQVTILFFTLKPRECTYPQLITIVNNAYKITCDIVYKSMGCVNKIILFDKDVMILVVFGLRGFKHESEAQAALKCSYSIKRSVSALDGVLEVSIGVTTGQVYCGVVGHPLRREFTVIGAIVNKAARFMCGFRNKITCDEATFVKSKMSSNGFTLQPKTILKGIPQPGKIYEYTEDIRVKELFNIPIIPPLLDRKEELKYLENWLVTNSTKRDFDALLIIGESRIGKTRLLEWMARCVKNKELRVCYISLTTVHSATPYLGINQIINQILDIKEPITGFAKEEKIVQILKSYDEDLCYLNNILKVRFAYHEGIYSQDEELRREKAKHIFTKLIMAVTETHVIFLDDLQNLDGLSWEFISTIFNSMNIFIVLTVTRGKFSSVCHWLYGVFANNNIRKIILGPLTSIWIAPLACQILDVDAVPSDFCNSLRLRCNGMPGLIESFILHLFSTGAIEIKKVQDDELGNWEEEEMQFPDSSLLRPMAIDAKDQVNLDNLIGENPTSEKSICVVTKKEELNMDINLQSLDTLIMIQIDSLTPYQQLLLKIASVIGNIVSRDLLESIMYENNIITTAKAIKRLFSMRILSCANAKYNYNYNRKRRDSTGTITSYSSINTEIVCECCFEYDSEDFYNLPKYAFCKVIKFTNSHSRKSCYELLPINQKREFHGRIVHYLENNKQKCADCGGTIMLVQSCISLQPEIPYAHGCNSLQITNEIEIDNDDEMETDVVPYTSIFKESIDLTRARSEALDNTNLQNELKRTTSEQLSQKNSVISSSSNRSVPPAPILKKSIDFAGTSRRSTKRVTVTSLIFKQHSSSVFVNCKIYDNLRPVMEAKNISDWHKLGIIDSTDEIIKEDKNISRESFNITIEKNVSQINFSKCTCAELNIVVHEQLINHAIEAELKMKALEFMIQYTYLNILSSNFETALSTLEKAEKGCTEDKSIEIGKFERKQFKARIYSLKAAAYLMCDNLPDAKQNIERALRIYRIDFDNVKDFFAFNGIIAGYTLKRKKYRKFNKTMKSHSIFCLNVAGLIYSSLGEEGKSKAATLRALSLVQKVDCNVIDMCDALSNSIQMEIDRGYPGATIDVERMAITALENVNYPIQAGELFALGKLFMAIFRARMSRGNLAATIRSGYKALVITRFLQIDDISMDIIPDLFYILLSRCRIEEAIDVLKLSYKLSNNHTSIECETWYYALCIDMILDAGFQLESPQDVSRYAEYALSKGKSAGPSRRRLVVSLWTYWLRTDSDRKAKRFESEALSWCVREDDDGTLTTLLSSMRLAEGMLESLARKVDDLKKIVDLMELRSLADKELSKLEKDAHALRAVYPRWLLLKSNSLLLSGRQSAATATLNQAMEEAQKVSNRLEKASARATTLNPKFWIQCAWTGQFLTWSTAIEQAQNAWHQLMYKVITKRYE